MATPIGNLEDISLRALGVLKSVALIAAEDTRHSKKLLNHFSIDTPLTSYHEHNESEKAQELIQEVLNGRDVALISDAGTPCISDPGYRLVRAAHEAGICVVSVPGPCAVSAALSISGLPTDRFTFHGFFPRKNSESANLLQSLDDLPGTHVFYESPNRLKKALEGVAKHLPEVEVRVARELTKTFEELLLGSAQEILDRIGTAEVKGECVLLLSVPSRTSRETEKSPEELRALVEELMRAQNLSRRDAVRRVAANLGISRNEVYSAAVTDE
ncbi:MAG: 16S rRNA (cytidine(1402)-2'-O)-methyltransferase [Candidatus Hydrogenedentes bacterium]|nr:16S rRNA (cytidine(1402)-2'-O)-methyltransferase [Candidatus Hydrogenedentota bacterium]